MGAPRVERFQVLHPLLRAPKRAMSLGQCVVIEGVTAIASSPTSLDDVAFISAVLDALQELHADSAVGWAVSAAHKSLLRVAEEEGIIKP
jgi:hypothetical protein